MKNDDIRFKEHAFPQKRKPEFLALNIMWSAFKKALTFEDVTMVPTFNRIVSRSHTTIHTLVHNHQQNYPFVPANMDTVISPVMCDKIAEHNGMMIYHRFCSLDEKLEMSRRFPRMYISCGIKDSERETIAQLIENGCSHFCIDVAHGHSAQVGDMIRYIRERCQSEQLSIIAGNVCTQDGYRQLVECGANIIKVGVGPGAACTTRMKTGFGVPQFTAILDCARAKRDLEKQDIRSWLIADGGIKQPRDACISIAAGADMVMMGSVFSKTQESAGEKQRREGDRYIKIDLGALEIGGGEVNAPEIYSHYRGQASLHFMKSQYGGAKTCVPEGEDFYLKCAGSFEDVLHEQNGSLRSSLTQAGSGTLPEFRNNVVFNTTTSNFLNESNTRRTD